MQNLDLIGRWIVIAGIALVVVGGLVWLLSKIPGINQLPGTLKIQLGDSFTCVFPILASIVLSILLTIVLNVIARIIKH
jgi:phosphotransferase system  glucose/maltose/N-acetylglucosamine-specific IIC component